MNPSDILLQLVEWTADPWVDLGLRAVVPFSVRAGVLAVHLAWFAVQNMHRAIPRVLEPPQVAELDSDGIWQEWIDELLQQEAVDV